MDLENQIVALKSEPDNATPTSLSQRNQDPASWLPKSVRHSMESHRETINCIALYLIYSSIASASEDSTIKIWDWELGELERTIKGHTRAVLDVDHGSLRGGIFLAFCSSDLTIKLRDPSDGYKNVRTLPGYDHSVRAVHFVPSGASSGNLLVSASRDKTMQLWDSVYCLKTLRGHVERIRDVCPLRDGRFLFTVGDDMTGRLWNISMSNPGNKLIKMVDHNHFVECYAITPPVSYQYFAPLAGLKKPPPASSTAEFMATGSRDKTIRLWDAWVTCLKTLVGHHSWVQALAFHPGGRYLLSVPDDKTLQYWDLSQDGKCVKAIVDAHDRFVACLR